jgi:hypothetical protein
MNPMNLRAIVPGLVAVLLTVAAQGSSAATPPANFNLNRQLERLEQQLTLTPAQKEQYDLAVGATKRALLQMALAGMRAKERIAEELAKPRPDLNVLWELRELLVEDGRPLRNEVRDEWRKLYALLDDEQVKIFKRFIDEQVDQLGILHDFLMQLVLAPRERI